MKGSARKMTPARIGLALAAPLATVVGVGIYYALEGMWGTPGQRAMIGAGVVVVLVTWLSWRFVFRPVRILLGGAEQVSGANLAFRFKVGREDEFGLIAKQFNWMLDEVQRARAEISSLKRVIALREERGNGGPVEIVQAAMERFSGEMDPDVLAESATEVFFKDLRADRCMLAICHEATNIISLNVTGQEAGQKISEKIQVPALPATEEELMSLRGWPAWERARNWPADKTVQTLSQALEAGGVLLGYASVCRDTHWPFSDDDKALFRALARNFEAALQNLRLRERSVTDGLTGLYARRVMEEMLEVELEKAQRVGIPLSVLMIDVNDFKRINDELGHAAGDEALRRVARHIRGSVRSVDHPCRYGGDEFLVLLVGTDIEGALTVARRILADVAESKGLEALPGRRELSLSIGVACFPRHCTTKAELMSLADKAMYEAKRQGGNALKEAAAAGVDEGA